MRCEICQIEIDAQKSPLSSLEKFIIFMIFCGGIGFYGFAVYGIIKFLE